MSGDIIIPTWSYAEESSAKAYQPKAENKYIPDETLSYKLAKKLEQNHKIYREPTITYQAMMGETWDDVQTWSKQGYTGVEMEAATVFSISGYFSSTIYCYFNDF